MSSIHPQHRVSLCHFTFSDGRRCRTPRLSSSPDFCHYHAEKDARDRTAAQLGDDFDALLSGHYISAGDLNAVLARLCAAVARGHVKPRSARTLAFLAQTLLQSIRLSQHEFTSAFGNNAWRQTIAGNVNHNIRYFRDQSQQKRNATSHHQPAQPRRRTEIDPHARPSPNQSSSSASLAQSASNRTTNNNGDVLPPHFQPHSPAASSAAPASKPRSARTSKLPSSAAAFAAAVLRTQHASEPPAISHEPLIPSATQTH